MRKWLWIANNYQHVARTEVLLEELTCLWEP
jgi:hypothetical protein